MSVTARWGVIASVALITSFTAYYSLVNTGGEQNAITTVMRGLGILALVVFVFLSTFFNKKQTPGTYTIKIGLQEGMKTALLAIFLYSVYNYVYLAYINPEYIQGLIDANVQAINATANEETMKVRQIEQVKESLTPFKGVTTDVLKLLAVSSMGAILSSILVKQYPM